MVTPDERGEGATMTTATTHDERTVTVAGGGVHVRTAGSGDPLVVLHHDIGVHAWTSCYERLAEHFTVHVPDLPGWGASGRPEWARSVRDIAVLAGALLDALDLERTSILGLGFGGYVAAELATVAQSRIHRLTLAGAMGVKPAEGEIFDQFLVNHQDYVRQGFASAEDFEAHFGEEVELEQLLAWDRNREMTTRVTWKPYMHNAALPHLLPTVQTPTLLVWGAEDRIVPLEAGHMYEAALPNARLEVVDGAGHWLELERPDELARLVVAHEG